MSFDDELVKVVGFGWVEGSQGAAEGLYRLVDAAYEKRSIAISSNLHPAGARLDRPHGAVNRSSTGSCTMHICQTTGDSIRLSQSLAGQGVNPLT